MVFLTPIKTTTDMPSVPGDAPFNKISAVEEVTITALKKIKIVDNHLKIKTCQNRYSTILGCLTVGMNRALFASVHMHPKILRTV